MGQKELRILGIQCKVHVSGTISIAEIREEMKKADSFDPALSHYAVVTTANRDSTIQKAVLSFSLENQSSGRFSIEIVFWDDLEELLDFHSDVRDFIYGGVSADQTAHIVSAVEQMKTGMESLSSTVNRIVDSFVTERAEVMQRLRIAEDDVRTLKQQLTSAFQRAERAERRDSSHELPSALAIARESGDVRKLLTVLQQERERAADDITSVLQEIASVAFMANEFDVAENALNEILLHNPADLHALHLMGRVFAESGNLDGAESTFLQVRQIGRTTANTGVEASALSNLGIVYRTYGKLGSARVVLNEALAIQLENGLEHQVPKTYVNLGSIYHLEGEFDAAEAMYTRALANARREVPDDTLTPMICLGMLFYERGDFTTSQLWLERALALAEEQNDDADIALVCGNLSSALSAQDRLDEAESLLRKALEIDSRLRNHKAVARHYGNLAMLHYSRVELSDAESLLTQAIDVSNRLGDLLTASTMLGNMAEVVLAKAAFVDKNFSPALEIAQQALEMETRIGRPSVIARRQVTLGRVYLACGDKAAAKELLKPALMTFERLGIPQMIALAREMLGHC